MMSRLFLCRSQAQTALYLFPRLRPSGCSPVSNHQLSLQVGHPIRLWCTLVWCGWWEVTPSITPTTTWSSSKLRVKMFVFHTLLIPVAIKGVPRGDSLLFSWINFKNLIFHHSASFTMFLPGQCWYKHWNNKNICITVINCIVDV